MWKHIDRKSHSTLRLQVRASGAGDGRGERSIGKVESYIGGTVATPTKQWEERFTYDPIGRLTQASERSGDNGQLTWRNTYSYDRFGNRYQPTGDQQALLYTPVETSDVDRATNHLVAPTVNTPGMEYDFAGQVTRDTKFRFKQFQYDANGRMTRAANLDDTGETTATYDGLGQRVQTMYAGQARIMVYDLAGQVVAEYGQPENDGGGLRYVFTDRQGSTRAVLDGQGQVKARKDYAPFGEEIGSGVGTRPGVAGYTGFDETRQQYALTERDKETKLDHTWWRKYDSGAGRWTSPDPYNGSMSLGDPQSFNRYAYVGNDPVNFVDPDGLQLISPNYRPPDNLSQGIGFFSPGIHSYEFYTQASSVVDGARQFYPDRGPFYGTFIVGGGVDGGTQSAGLFVEGYDAPSNNKIREEVATLFTVDCAKAFSNAGLLTPGGVIRNGLTIRSSNDLYNNSAAQLKLVSELTRKTYANEFSSGRAQAGTVPASRRGQQLTTDGRSHIYLHSTAFAGESYLFNRSSFHDVLVHEFIHAAGQPPISSLLGHDLSNFKHYSAILKACQ